MTLEAEKIAEELTRRPGDDQDGLSDVGDGGTGSGMTTPAPAVNGIVSVCSEVSLTGTCVFVDFELDLTHFQCRCILLVGLRQGPILVNIFTGLIRDILMPCG